MKPKLRWLPVEKERGLVRRAYLHPGGRLEVKPGIYYRIKAWSRTSYKGPCESVRQARQARVQALAEYGRQRAGGLTAAPTQQTIAEIVIVYLEEQNGQVEDYRAQARYGEFWTARFGPRPVLSLTPAEVRRARASLKNKDLTDSTANHYVKFLRTMMTRLVKPRAWVLEFWSEIEIPKALPATTRSVYTADQEARLHRKLRPIDILFCRLAYLLGIRAGQIATLQWPMVAWTEGAFGLVKLPKFKRHPARSIPLVAESLAILQYLWQQQRKPERGPVFPALGQTALSMNYHNWYNRHFLKALKAAKLDGLGLDFHALRHTWATRLGSKVPTRVLQILAGWTDIRMAEPYTGTIADQIHTEAMAHVSRFGSKTAVKRILEGRSEKHKTP